MAQTTYGPSGVTLRFPGWEAVMAGRSMLHIPPHAIMAARAESGWTSEVLGMRSGIVISGLLKLGTFTHPSGTRRLVSMRRGMPLLRLRTDRRTTGYDEVLLSTEDAEPIARTMQGSLAR